MTTGGGGGGGMRTMNEIEFNNYVHIFILMLRLFLNY